MGLDSHKLPDPTPEFPNMRGTPSVQLVVARQLQSVFLIHMDHELEHGCRHGSGVLPQHLCRSCAIGGIVGEISVRGVSVGIAHAGTLNNEVLMFQSFAAEDLCTSAATARVSKAFV